MDRTGWIALIVCFVLLITYPLIINRFYPPVPAPPPVLMEDAPGGVDGLPVPAGDGSAEGSAPATAPPALAPVADSRIPELVSGERGPVRAPNMSEEELYTLENEFARFLFTSHGGGLKRVELLQHFAEGVDPVELNRGDEEPVLNLKGWDGRVTLTAYELTNRGVDTLTFSRPLAGGLRMERLFRLVDDYQLQIIQTVYNPTEEHRVMPGYELHLGTASADYLRRAERRFIGAGWMSLSGSYTSKKMTGFDGFGFLGLQFTHGKPLLDSPAGRDLRWAAVKSQFFTIILRGEDTPLRRVVAYQKFFPELREKNEDIPDGVSADVMVPGLSLDPGGSFTQTFTLYAGPKEDWRLRALPDSEDRVMEFGWMGWVSRPLLSTMNFIHGYIGNYGWSIVILTLLIKAILWIPQSGANRSMKRMQAVAPLMKEIQEKYKGDQQKLSAEMMKIYQDYGVNPVGGCLPLLIQLPVFMGFYFMLQSAIELRHADFLWVADLSQPDTVYRIPALNFPLNPMPLLMAVTMYFSMSMMPKPQGVDNPMFKIMKWMPAIFLLFCYTFASALSLYWTVQNLIGMVQMQINLRQEAPTLEELKKQAEAKRKKRKKAVKRKPGTFMR